MTWSLIDHLTDGLAKDRPGDSKHPTLWPSQATGLITLDNGDKKVVGKCRRARFFGHMLHCYNFYPEYSFWSPLVQEIKSKKKPKDRYMLWIWAQGELYEDYIIEQAKKTGIFINGQIPVYIKEQNVSGKIDLEAINPKTGKLTITEVKSVYGYGGNFVLGTPSQRRSGQLGEPRESNLMQLALYHWHRASEDPAFEESRLLYGSRDTGRYGEYLVKTEAIDEQIKILYKPNLPNATGWVDSKITINSILESYHQTTLSVVGGMIPDRDYDLTYSPEKIQNLYDQEELNKTDTKSYKKWLLREAYNKWVAKLDDTPDDNLLDFFLSTYETYVEELNKPVITKVSKLEDSRSDKNEASMLKAIRTIKAKKPLKPLTKGDWQCDKCDYTHICYNQKGEPREL